MPTGSAGVVVGPVHPDELDPLIEEELDRLRCFLEELLALGRRRCLAAIGSDQCVEIGSSRLLAVFRAMQRAVRYPGDTARISGGSAEYRLLLDDQRRATQRLGRKCGRNRPSAAANDHQIEALVVSHVSPNDPAGSNYPHRTSFIGDAEKAL